jgi:RHS repeat-associated protein
VIDGAGGTAHQTFVLKVTADTMAPKVRVNRCTSLINLGSTVSFQVVATDNVSVANLQLLINGIPVVTDSNGVVSFTAITAGVITATAVALDAAGNRAEATTTVDVFDPTDTEAPIVSLDLSGIENGEITGPVEITGSVKDANLDYYVLEVAPADGSQPFKEMFRGRSLVNNGALGVLDPTLLINDTYQVRLIAYDVNGLGNSVSAALDIQGNLKLGNFQVAFTDIEIPVAGIPITLTRTYDTLTSNSKSDFGYGWRMEFRNAQVRTSLPKDELYEELGIRGVGFKEGDSVYVTLPGGKRERFTFRLEAINVLVNSFLRRRGLYKPVFVADKGSTSTLNVDTAGIVLIRGDDNRVVPLSGGSAFSYYNPQDWGNAYRLTTKEGVVYNINATTGDINAITNRNGDVLTFSDGGIVSSHGQQVTFERDAQGRIVAAIDPLGMRVTYQYDAQGDLVKVTDRDKNSTTFEYNDQRPHYLDKVIDPLGQTGIRNEYDQNGRLAKVFNALGNGAQLEYNPENSLYTTKDALGNSTTYEYDLRGNVITEVDAKGGISRRTYDADNNKLSETNPAGATTHYTYDRRGNKLTETDALGNITRYTYNTNGDLLSTANALGNTVINTYDSNGNPTAISGLANGPINLVYGADGLLKSLITAEGTTTYEYDRQGNITKEINPLGHATTYTYDGNGNRLTETRRMATPDGFQTLVTTMQYNSLGDVIKVTDPLGNVTQMSYDPNGHKSQEIDALGRVTKFVYSSVGQLLETIYPDLTPDNDSDNPRIRKEYDAANRLVAEIDELGRRTEFQYDAMGRLTFTLFPDLTPSNASDNPRTESRYDDVGRVIAEVDERGNVTRYEYDALGRRTKTILPDGTADNDSDNPQLIVSYDALGRQLTQVDPLGRTTQFLYDSLGRLIGQIFADQTDILTTYDLAGRVVAKTDQMGNKTQYEYNSVGQLVAVIDALNQRTEYQYNELGNLINDRDALGNVTRHDYDGLGRRIRTYLPLSQEATMNHDAVGNLSSTTDFNGDTIHYEYDERNRLLSRSFPDNSRVTYTYTQAGKRATETSPLGTITYSYDMRDNLLSRVDADGVKIEYSYDAAKNRTAIKIPSGQVDYIHDEQNRLKMVTSLQAGVTTYSYDLSGNLTKTTLGNGSVETRQYDALNRLSYLHNSNSSGLINSFRYGLDKAGNRLSVTEQHGSSTSPPTTRIINYDYDELYRLSKESVTGDPIRTTVYSYDAASNLLTRNNLLDGYMAYEYDSNNRLLKGVVKGGAITYVYDNNGNILNKSEGLTTLGYDWDFQNRLTGADIDGDGTNDVINEYDGDGIRIRTTVLGDQTRFLVDKDIDHPQVLEEYLPSGVIAVSYIYGHDLISQFRDTRTSFYHVDGLGSARALTDVNGLVTDSYSYAAYGDIIDHAGTTPNVYLFAGEQFDPNMDFYYLRARYYDPKSRRFTASDSFPGDPRHPITLHRYLYANANPALYIDPSGNFFSLSGIGTALSIMSTMASIGSVAYNLSEGNYQEAAEDAFLGIAGGVLGLGLAKVIGPASKIRLRYVNFLRIDMRQKHDQLRLAGRSTREIAQTLIWMRNSVKIETRAMMKADIPFGGKLVKFIELRNLRAYQHPIGPDMKYYAHKNADAIIEGAFKSNHLVDRMLLPFF